MEKKMSMANIDLVLIFKVSLEKEIEQIFEIIEDLTSPSLGPIYKLGLCEDSNHEFLLILSINRVEHIFVFIF